MITFSSDPVVAEQQMHALIFYLTSFGYVDGNFDNSEKAFIRKYIAQLVERRADDAAVPAASRDEIVGRWTTHFHEAHDQIDHGICSDLLELVAQAERAEDFAIARLKPRCFELLKQFDEDNRTRLLALVDELKLADGTVHPTEQAFRDELFALLRAPLELDAADLQPLAPGAVVIDVPVQMNVTQPDHPFFTRTEFDYVRRPEELYRARLQPARSPGEHWAEERAEHASWF
jgi:uncharacterized tellurite resistance protein B-like protein